MSPVGDEIADKNAKKDGQRQWQYRPGGGVQHAQPVSVDHMMHCLRRDGDKWDDQQQVEDRNLYIQAQLGNGAFDIRQKCPAFDQQSQGEKEQGRPDQVNCRTD